MNNIDKYTDREWEELASLLSDEFSEQENLLSNFVADDKYDTAQKWKDLRKIGTNMEINVDAAWDKLTSKLGEEETEIADKRRFIRSNFLRIAAVAIILVGIGTAIFYLYNSGALTRKINVITDNSQMNIQVKLPDGSNVFLNRDTRISYKSDFKKTGRLVQLEGEAFFEITPSDSNPFTVDAGNASIRVIGTSFNVISTNNDSAVEVLVSTGKVMLEDNSGSQNLIVEPGYVGIISSTFSEKKRNIDPNYIAWRTGKLIYEGQNLDVVFNDLERIYKVEIVATDPNILNQSITAVFDNEPIETKIRIICATFNLSYQKDGDIYHVEKK